MVIEASQNVYIAAAAALLGALCVGVTIGYSGPALETMLQISTSNSTDRIATDKDKSLVGASITLGALVGGLVGAPISQYAGRKRALIIYGIPYAIGCGIIYIAKSVTFVIFGRVITGFVAGMICVTAPAYVIEISTPNTRGFLGASFQIFITIGIFIMAFFGIFATVTYNYFFNWRYLALFGILPSVIMSIAMLGMPESPVWLMTKYGRTSVKPEKALTRLRTPKSDVQGELDEMQEQANQAKSMSFTSDQLKRPDYWKPAVLGLALMLFQQFSGINIVMFFQTQILKEARGTADTTEADSSNYAAVGTAISCFAQVVATIGGGLVMDRLGRRKLLLISGGGHAVSLFVLGFYFYSRNPVKVAVTNATQLLLNTTTTKIPEQSSLPTFVPVVCLVIFIVSFSLGYGPIPWLMIPEMTPAAVRTAVSSICTAVNWSCAFITSFSFDPLTNAIGVSTTFWMYAVICAISCLFVIFFLPETKGKSFDEIQREFAGKPLSVPVIPRTKSGTQRSTNASVSLGESVSAQTTGLSSAMTSAPSGMSSASSGMTSAMTSAPTTVGSKERIALESPMTNETKV